jgi:hypothetical protein
MLARLILAGAIACAGGSAFALPRLAAAQDHGAGVAVAWSRLSLTVTRVGGVVWQTVITFRSDGTVRIHRVSVVPNAQLHDLVGHATAAELAEVRAEFLAAGTTGLPASIPLPPGVMPQGASQFQLDTLIPGKKLTTAGTIGFLGSHAGLEKLIDALQKIATRIEQSSNAAPATAERTVTGFFTADEAGLWIEEGGRSIRVMNAPFGSLLAKSTGLRVTAFGKVTTIGASAGEIQVEWVRGEAKQQLMVLAVHAAEGGPIAVINGGDAVKITGVQGKKYLTVKLDDGRDGLVLAKGVKIGEAVLTTSGLSGTVGP